MAITKERLEELIKEGATIYTIKHNGVDVMELHLKNTSDDFWYFLLGMKEELFEDKAEVEEKAKKIKWSLKYQHIPRTEELNLPTWEEFITEDKYNYYGTSYFGFDNYRLIAKLPDEDDDCEFIGIDVDGNTELYHWDEATEENYEKACDLCIKLFKGEEK